MKKIWYKAVIGVYDEDRKLPASVNVNKREIHGGLIRGGISNKFKRRGVTFISFMVHAENKAKGHEIVKQHLNRTLSDFKLDATHLFPEQK